MIDRMPTSPVSTTDPVEGLSPFCDQLLQFPLFQGLSRTELLQIAGNTRFGFLKKEAGEILVSEGEACRQLYFLVKGTLQTESKSDDGSYRMVERLHSPFQLQPEALFGSSLRYTFTARTLTDCHFIVLSKDEVMHLFDDIFIFRINYLNLLAAQSQQRGHRQWRKTPATLTDRLIRFLIDHSLYPAGYKELYILMRQLAAELNDSRINVSMVLNELQKQGRIQLFRGRIVIPSLELLLM